MARNTVRINSPIIKEPEMYRIGTMFDVKDDSACDGGVYMLVASGDCPARAILSNLSLGSVRNSGMEMQDGFSVSRDSLEACLRHAKYTVVRSITITAVD